MRGIRPTASFATIDGQLNMYAMTAGSKSDTWFDAITRVSAQFVPQPFIRLTEIHHTPNDQSTNRTALHVLPPTTHSGDISTYTLLAPGVLRRKLKWSGAWARRREHRGYGRVRGNRWQLALAACGLLQDVIT